MELLQAYFSVVRTAPADTGLAATPMSILASLVRIAMASARLLLQKHVLVSDAVLAIRLVEESICSLATWRRDSVFDQAVLQSAHSMPLDEHVALLQDILFAPGDKPGFTDVNIVGIEE